MKTRVVRGARHRALGVVAAVLAVAAGSGTAGAAPVIIQTVGVGAHPWGIAANPATNRVYVANYNSNTVSVIDGITNTVSTVGVGSYPIGVAVNPATNRAYVANYGSGTVSVIDGGSNAVIATIGGFSCPYENVAVNPSTNRIYVPNYCSNTVSVIDGATNAVSTVGVGTNPIGVAVNPATNRVYVANFSSGTVSVIDGATNAVVATVGGIASPWGVASNPSTNRVYVTGRYSSLVWVIDGGTSSVVTSIGVGSYPQGVEVNPSTNRVHVVNAGSNTMSMIDGETNSVVATVGGLCSPYDVAINSSTGRLYVSNASCNNVALIEDDIVAPETSITATPSNPTNSTSASFSFSGTDDFTPWFSLSFQCQLDFGGFSACTSPRSHSGLSLGSHVFQVRAIDRAGNIDPTPATFGWTIDVTPPDTSITAVPTNPTNNTTATLGFTGTDNVTPPGALSFECRLDGGGFSSCASPASYPGLSPGSHTFEVRAVDRAGNVDPGPASYSWVVDTAPPDTAIGAAPRGYANFTDAGFGFAGADDLTPSGLLSFQCQLDGGGFSSCASPTSYSSLAPGSHAFEVRAVDRAGNVDPTAARHDWIVDVGAPTSTFGTVDGAVLVNVSGLAATPVTGRSADDLTGIGEVTVSFVALTPGAVGQSGPAMVSCSDASRVSCAWAAFPPSAVGRYEVHVQASDRAGNVESPGPPPITVIVVATPA